MSKVPERSGGRCTHGLVSGWGFRVRIEGTAVDEDDVPDANKGRGLSRVLDVRCEPTQQPMSTGSPCLAMALCAVKLHAITDHKTFVAA